MPPDPSRDSCRWHSLLLPPTFIVKPSTPELIENPETESLSFIVCFLLGLFLTFGCSGVVPAIHFMVAYGVTMAHRQASVGWMALMGLLYILGAIMYATRIPERFFPGKCDIWVSMSPLLALCPLI